jgi:hypothetical protein
MSDQIIYNILTTIFYLFFGIIWKSSNATNVFIKIFCIVLAIAGGFITLKEFGYIIKV